MTTTLTALQAIVFDFDGVLADSEPLHLHAFQEVFGRHGFTLDEGHYYSRYLGFDDAGVFSQVSADFSLGWGPRDIETAIAEKAVVFKDIASSASIMFPGAVERLRQWSSLVPIGIASGALRVEIEMILRGAGVLDTVRVIVGGGDTRQGKPAPDPYRRALELLSESVEAAGSPAISPVQTVAIEDSVWGIESARGAGMRVVALATTYPADRLTLADRVVATLDRVELTELDELVKK